MRDKLRFLVFRHRVSKDKAKTFSSSQIQDLIQKEIIRLHGDFGLALCGPRLRIYYFGISTNGLVIRVRREAADMISSVMKTFRAFTQIHVAGSTRLAQKAIKRHFPNDSFIPEDLLA